MILASLARIGGVIVAPRKTLTSIIAGEGGSLFELLPWFVIVAVTVSPTEAGQAILLGRMDLADGAQAFLGLIANRTGGAIAGAVAGGAVLAAVGRARGLGEPGFDRAVDACFFCLVPHLILAALGAFLSSIGHELWYMPHRMLRGQGWFFAARFIAAYGWALALFGILFMGVITKSRKQAPGDF